MNRSREKGFTLVEGLVVLGIIGLLALITGVQTTNYLSKANIEGTAGELRSFLESAKSLMVSQNSPITFRYQVVGGKPVLQLLRTTGGPLRTLTLPEYVKAAVNPGAVAPSAWTAPSPGTLFTCDTQGRTLGSTGVHVTGVQTISFTHRGMVDEAGYSEVRPRMRFDVELYPLWTVRMSKRIY